MNFTKVKAEAHTILFDKLERIKRGRNVLYIDSRNKAVDGGYLVHPIAEDNSDIYVVCPYCQTIHRHAKKHIREHQGYIEANCKGRLVFGGKLALLDRGCYFIQGWCDDGKCEC